MANESGPPVAVGSDDWLGAGAAAPGTWPDQEPPYETTSQRGGCSGCRFAGPRHGYDSYPCRRRAPIAAHDPNQHCGVYQEAFVPRWPLMNGRDWCGEFESA